MVKQYKRAKYTITCDRIVVTPPQSTQTAIDEKQFITFSRSIFMDRIISFIIVLYGFFQLFTQIFFVVIIQLEDLISYQGQVTDIRYLLGEGEDILDCGITWG